MTQDVLAARGTTDQISWALVKGFTLTILFTVDPYYGNLNNKETIFTIDPYFGNLNNKETILFTIDPYHGNLNNKETILFTIDPYYGNLKLNPLTRARSRVKAAPLVARGKSAADSTQGLESKPAARGW